MALSKAGQKSSEGFRHGYRRASSGIAGRAAPTQMLQPGPSCGQALEFAKDTGTGFFERRPAPQQMSPVHPQKQAVQPNGDPVGVELPIKLLPLLGTVRWRSSGRQTTGLQL